MPEGKILNIPKVGESQPAVLPEEARELLTKPIKDIEAEIARTRKKIEEIRDPVGLGLEVVRSGDVLEVDVAYTVGKKLVKSKSGGHFIEQETETRIRPIPARIEVLRPVNKEAPWIFIVRLSPETLDTYSSPADRKVIQKIAALKSLRLDTHANQLVDSQLNQAFGIELRTTLSRKKPEPLKPDNSIDISDLIDEEASV